MTLNKSFILKIKSFFAHSNLFALVLSIFILAGTNYGMTVSQKNENQIELRTSKNSCAPRISRSNYLTMLVMGCCFVSYNSFFASDSMFAHKNCVTIKPSSTLATLENFKTAPTISPIKSRHLQLIERQNDIWNQYNVSIQENNDMPYHFYEQLHHDRYLPVKSPQKTDDQGTIGEGANGITFLVIDRKTERLTVAKFIREDLEDSKKTKAIKHIQQELKYSKKWQKITGYGLNVRLLDNVIYKDFIFGKQLSDWLKSGKIFSDTYQRQKLLEFYENMFSQHKQIMDLQYDNLVFDELKQDWAIIDAGDVLSFGTMEEALEVYLKNYIYKYTHNLRFYGNEKKKQEYYENIDKFAQAVKEYCFMKKAERENNF